MKLSPSELKIIAELYIHGAVVLRKVHIPTLYLQNLVSEVWLEHFVSIPRERSSFIVLSMSILATSFNAFETVTPF